MRVTVKFDSRADLSDREEIVRKCLTSTSATTARWLDDRTLTYTTANSALATVECWEWEGFNISEFDEFSFSAERSGAELVMPASLSVSEQAARLVGREYSSLTPTEAKIHDHLSMYGELYWASYDQSTGVVETDSGHPGDRVSIRVPPGTPASEAVWELAHVVYHLSEMPSS